MKKWTALLLALVLSLSLLPTAALADNTHATGVYTALNEDGTPGGICISATQNSDNVWGYWNLSYSNAQNIFYYYDPQATCLTVPEGAHGVSTEPVSGKDNLWKITVTGRSDEFVIDLVIGNGSYCFEFIYSDPSESDQKPREAGLYYRHLIENREDGSIREGDDYFRLDGIELAPYVTRRDLALYYFNGETYEAVNRVRLPFGSGFDMVWVRDWMRDDALPAHWYYLSAYDFSESKLYYYTGENYAAPDATPTGSIELNSHQLPETAFYADSTTSLTSSKDAEDIYRMYTVMDWNTDASKPYKYTTTLYLRATDAAFTFDQIDDLTDKCVQRHYDKNGMENAENPETEYKDYILYTKQIEEGKALEVTIYANDTDLLLWLYGPEGDGQYVAYVNLLAPENTQLHLNDQGFEAAKYLPHHLFRQLADRNLPITLSAGAYAADITCNADLTADIAEKSAVALEVNRVDADELSDTQTAIAAVDTDATVVGAVDITLTCDGKAQHEFTEGGSATVSYPCDLDLADGATVLVYHVYTESGEEKTEQIEAVYDAEAKCVTFSTTHFSRFVIVTIPSSSATNTGGSSGGSEKYAVTADSSKNGSVTVSPKRAKKGDTVTVTVTPDDGYTPETVIVTDKDGKELKLTKKGDGTYTFTMPSGKVTVTATFLENNSMLNFFVDVTADKYYYDAVLWAAENGVTSGVDDTHFGPDTVCTRAQLAAFLYRYAQSQGKGFTGAWMFRMPFTDVSDWCYEAVAWCYMNGVVQGYSEERFGSGDTVSRQQVVTMLYRFAEAMGMDVSAGADTDLPGFNDAVDVPEYAVSAFQWAVSAGIVQGNNGYLNPTAPCTRAQIVTFLYRLLGD